MAQNNYKGALIGSGFNATSTTSDVIRSRCKTIVEPDGKVNRYYI